MMSVTQNAELTAVMRVKRTATCRRCAESPAIRFDNQRINQMPADDERHVLFPF